MESILKKCEFCSLDAKCICFECMSYFCDNCFKICHNNEIKKSHKKDKFDYFVPIDIKCQEHKLHPNDLFCINEKGKLI